MGQSGSTASSLGGSSFLGGLCTRSPCPALRAQVIVLNGIEPADFDPLVAAFEKLVPSTLSIKVTKVPQAAVVTLDALHKGRLVVLQFHDAAGHKLHELAQKLKDHNVLLSTALVSVPLASLLTLTPDANPLIGALQFGVIVKSAPVTESPPNNNLGKLSRRQVLELAQKVDEFLLNSSSNHQSAHKIDFTVGVIKSFLMSALHLDDPLNGHDNPQVYLVPREDYDAVLDMSRLDIDQAARLLQNVARQAQATSRKSSLFTWNPQRLCSTPASKTCRQCLHRLFGTMDVHEVETEMTPTVGPQAATATSHPNANNKNVLPPCLNCLNELANSLRHTEARLPLHGAQASKKACPAARCDLRALERELFRYHQVDSNFHQDDNTYMHSLWTAQFMDQMFAEGSPYVAGIAPEMRQKLVLAAFLHDVGKTGDDNPIFLGKTSHPKTVELYWSKSYPYKWLDYDQQGSLPDYLKIACPTLDDVDHALFGVTGTMHMRVGDILQKKMTPAKYIEELAVARQKFKSPASLEDLARYCFAVSIADVMGASEVSHRIPCDPADPPLFYPHLAPKDDSAWFHSFQCRKKWADVASNYFDTDTKPVASTLALRDQLLRLAVEHESYHSSAQESMPTEGPPPPSINTGISKEHAAVDRHLEPPLNLPLPEVVATQGPAFEFPTMPTKAVEDL
eukprot:NODE_568_length_2306_cov_80.174072_g540_i0.p1 GENE.NODE_568_length_2306_cov_80.174072_g540_i0~~NODE_568_length_2306_cov_80.174072_g540_i0.p1  ORF type:complete len:681 (-),score=120.10 NODE_568_length_2306_cov_80.174072_g540_i0:187-2229(-)